MTVDLNRVAPSNGRTTVVWAVLAFSILSIAAALTSDGFLEADAATHYLFARYALHTPFYLVNVWGRPLTTALYALPAALAGRAGARMASLFCAIACALFAWRLAVLERYRWPALAAIFTLGQPLLFLHSFSEMTELPFATLAVFAFWAYRRQYWGSLALASSLLPLGRPEGFGFCALAGVALVFHRRWYWLPILVAPVVAWSYIGWVVEGHNGVWWLWLRNSWPYSATSDYPRGSPLRFVLELPVLVSPAAVPALFIGIRQAFAADEPMEPHVRRCRRLIAAIPLTVLVAHSIFYWRGIFSSNGELRYLLIVAPFWGLLAASGWEWAFARLHLRAPAATAALFLILPAQINWLFRVVPISMTADWRSAQSLLNWYRASPLRHDYPHLLFAHPALDYFLDAGPDDAVRSTPWERYIIASPPPGTLLIWDDNYAVRNSDPARDLSIAQIAGYGWQALANPPGVDAQWRLFLSRAQPR